jgi:Trypsin-like peptidase domain
VPTPIRALHCVLLKGVVALFGAMLLLSVSVHGQDSPPGLLRQKPSKSSETKNQTGLDLKKVSRAVASVLVDTLDGKTVNQGSGFFIDSTGRMVTNYHVIEDASSAIVKTSDGGFYQVDGTIAVDEKHDLAILKVAGSNFAYLPLGDSNTVSVGQKVYAIGSPLGLEATVSDGIVSSIRELDQLRFIQTTAPISHGSSGGPLLNLRGQVVRVTTLQVQEGQNLNFAIPSSLIRPLLLSEKVTPFAPPQMPEPPKATAAKNAAPKLQDDFSDLPQSWTGTLDKNQYSVRILGEHIYIKSTFMEETSIKSTFLYETIAGLLTQSFSCDGKRQGDKWVGTCVHSFSIYWPGGVITPCSLSLNFQILSLSKQRIEGRVQSYGFDRTGRSNCPTVEDKDTQIALIPL